MKWKKILVWEIFNVFTFFYCAFISIRNQIEYPFYLLPLIYSILFILCHKSRKLIGKTPGITVIMVVMFFRYIVLPIVLCNEGKLSIYANDYKSVNAAIFIMIYEMIAIFIVLELTACKALKTYDFQIKSDKKIVAVKPPVLIVLLIGCAIIGIYFTNRDILNGNIFLINDTVNDSIQDVSSAVKILWQCITSWIFVYGINRQKDKYTVDQKNRHIGISILYMLIFVIITYMGQARISRWYTLVSSIAAIFILISLFPEKTSIITITTVIPVVVLIVLASLLKAGLYTQGNHLHFQISELITPTSGDAYFAGPVSINNAIGLSKIKGIGFRNIIYDICNNMPIVNHFVKTGNSTAYLYNSYLGRIFNSSGGDQIISLVGQSGIFFSWIFAPLLSCISVLFLRFSDKKYLQTTNYMKYIWGFIAIWFGLETILNMTINLSWIYIRIIPMFIIFWLIDKISFKQIKKEVC